MSLLSKVGALAGGIVGGTAGFFMGGPMGAVVGAGIGAGAGEKKIGGTSKFWDTHIGRKGLIGEGGEMLGLWKSGTTVDAENRAVKAVEGLRAETTDRYNKQVQAMDQGLLTDLLQQSYDMEKTDFDNARPNQINRLIQKSITNRNEMYTNNIQQKLNAEESYEDRMANYDREIENIRA